MFHVDLDLDIERNDDERLIRLRAGDGEAILRVLGADHQGSFSGHRYGDAFLSAPDRKRGAAFVQTLARWLDRSIDNPSRGLGELTDFPCSYTQQVDPAGEHLRISMDSWSAGASIMLFIEPEARSCKLLTYALKEKELRALTVALRDGWPPPRRGPGDDPLFATGEPLVPKLSSLPGSRRVSRSAWVGGKLLGLIEHGDEFELLFWDSLERAPRSLWRFNGFPVAIEPSPDGRWAALVIYHWTPEHTCSSESATVLLVPLDPLLRHLYDVLPLMSSDESFSVNLDAIRWSPTGERVAIRGHDRTSLMRPEVIHVYDVRERQLESTHRPSSLVSEPKGVALPTWVVRSLEPHMGVGRAPRRSPDRRFLVSREDESLIVTDRQGARRRFSSTRECDIEAVSKLEVHATWLGGSAILLDSDDLYVLDLATLKLRYLLPPLPLGAFFWSTSSDQRLVLVPRRKGIPGIDAAGDLWGEVVW